MKNNGNYVLPPISPGQEWDLGDIAPIHIRCRIGGKLYQLNEKSAEAARKHTNAMTAGARMGDDGKPTVSLEKVAIADLETQLVADCLYEVRVNRDRSEALVPVPLSVIRSWPERIPRQLAMKINELSQLTQLTDEPDDVLEPGGDGMLSRAHASTQREAHEETALKN